MSMTKLGKTFRFRYIPFSQLIKPREMCHFGYEESIDTIPLTNSRCLNTVKREQIRVLAMSIRRYGLLNPLSVVDITKLKEAKINKNESGVFVNIQDLIFNIDKTKDSYKGKYLLIDGQRRYLAIERILCELYSIRSGEYTSKILIPCLVYDYDSIEQCMRHSIEDNRFSVIPSNKYLECAERKNEAYAPSKEDKDIRNLVDLSKTKPFKP